MSESAQKKLRIRDIAAYGEEKKALEAELAEARKEIEELRSLLQEFQVVHA